VTPGIMTEPLILSHLSALCFPFRELVECVLCGCLPEGPPPLRSCTFAARDQVSTSAVTACGGRCVPPAFGSFFNRILPLPGDTTFFPFPPRVIVHRLPPNLTLRVFPFDIIFCSESGVPRCEKPDPPARHPRDVPSLFTLSPQNFSPV